MSTLICIGVCGGAFGVKGEVKIKSFTADPKDVFAYGPLHDENGAVILTITSSRPIKGGFAARANEIKTREEAQSLKGQKLYVDRSVLPKADADEFYYEDLIGLNAHLPDGTQMGRVKSVHDFGAGDVLQITGGTDANGKPIAAFFHPFTKAAVPEIDIPGGQITIVIEEPEIALAEIDTDIESGSDTESDLGAKSGED